MAHWYWLLFPLVAQRHSPPMGAGWWDLFVRLGSDPHLSCQYQVGHFQTFLTSCCLIAALYFLTVRVGCGGQLFFSDNCMFPLKSVWFEQQNDASRARVFLSYPRSLSFILILDLSKPNVLWETMEKLLQAAQAQLEKVLSKAQQAQRTKPGAKHQMALQSTARVLPKDYPVSPLLITLAI